MHVSVRDMMDVVFSVCIVRRGSVSARIWEVEMFRLADFLNLCLMCILCQFCMTCSLLLLVEDERGDHKKEPYSRSYLMSVLQVAMSVSIC